MTDSGEVEEGVSGDGETSGDAGAARSAKHAAKVSAKAAKIARKSAKAEARAAASAARAADKAARKVARKAAKASAKADARTLRAVEKRERKVAKAEAKARKVALRDAEATAQAGERQRSPAVAAAGVLLEEAAELMRRGETVPDHTAAASLVTPELEAPEPAPEPAPAEASEPESVAEEEGAPEPDPEVPEPAADLEHEPVSAKAPEPEVPEATEPGQEPQAALEPEPAADLEPEPAPEPEPVAPVAESEFQRGFVEPEPAPEAEVEAAAPEPAPEAPETEEPEPEVPEPEAEAQPDLAESGEAADVDAALEQEPMGSAAGADDVTLAEPEPAVGPHVGAPTGAQIAAAIDIGATSVHLLVGTIDGRRVAPLLDESVFLGLGDRVSTTGCIGDEGRRELLADLERYVAAARELGATSIAVVGTDPLRRAQDAPAVVHALTERVGVPLYILDQAEEGLLTLIGATGGRPVNGELLLVDVGGGSTEFVIVRRDGTTRSAGIPLGAALMTRNLVRSDPPSLAEIEALRVETARLVAGAPDAMPVQIVAVGGTASNLIRLLPATAVDRSLTRRRIAVALAMLTVERSSEAAARHLLRPERARILPAGAIIVDAILEKYGADRLAVSEEGIREGAILAGVHGGFAWRDQLAELAAGWTEPSR